MEYEAIINYLMSLSPYVQYVLMGLGGLVVLGGAYVKMTPSEADDQWYASLENMAIVGQIFKLLVKFSPIARK